MSVRTILVSEAQVPSMTGGAAAHVRQRIDALRQRGCEAAGRTTWDGVVEKLVAA